jgi:4-aminobutyrate---pyruvate transaminase
MSSMLYPTTNLDAIEELTLVRGEGIYVFDDAGNRYLDGMSGLWCASLGYGNAEIAETARAQISTLSYAHMFGGKTHPTAIELASKIASMVPVKDAHVFFGNSGSDANDTQLKLLQYYYNGQGKPAKKKVISRERAYHGVSVAASTLTGLPTTHAGFDTPFDTMGVIRVEAAHYYRQKLEGESEESFVDRLIANLGKAIEANGAEHIAAMIIEPVVGAGGVVVPPAGYLPRLAKVLRDNDILLWDDEVICGFGRTGNDFGCTTYGIEPDMMVFAKGLSSAYMPISAAVVSGAMYEGIVEQSRKAGVFGHGYTYSGHPVCCAVALKVLEIYARDHIFARARETGEYLQQRLVQFDQHPLVGEVRGVGMIAALELVADKQTGRAFKDGKVGAYAQKRCQAHGLILRAVAGTSLAICPPLITTHAQVDELVAQLNTALDETLAYVAANHLNA